MFVGSAHLGFHGVFRDMQFIGYFLVSQRFKNGQFQYFPALVGQFFKGQVQAGILFLVVEKLFIAGNGKILSERFGKGAFFAMVVNDVVAKHQKKIVFHRIVDFNFFPVLPQFDEAVGNQFFGQSFISVGGIGSIQVHLVEVLIVQPPEGFSAV
jgi:hypothetical protein